MRNQQLAQILQASAVAERLRSSAFVPSSGTRDRGGIEPSSEMEAVVAVLQANLARAKELLAAADAPAVDASVGEPALSVFAERCEGLHRRLETAEEVATLLKEQLGLSTEVASGHSDGERTVQEEAMHVVMRAVEDAACPLAGGEVAAARSGSKAVEPAQVAAAAGTLS